jgi:DNA-binding NarL/FixJ family response regulator
LVTIDIGLRGADGIELIRSMKQAQPDLRILVISMQDESLFAERCLRAGAMGYISKTETANAVQAAMWKVLRGQMHLSTKMASAVISKFMRSSEDRTASPLKVLSDRELLVFKKIGEGRTIRDIAKELQVTIPTVNSFRNRIKEKLRLKTATQLVVHAVQWTTADKAD